MMSAPTKQEWVHSVLFWPDFSPQQAFGDLLDLKLTGADRRRYFGSNAPSGTAKSLRR